MRLISRIARKAGKVLYHNEPNVTPIRAAIRQHVLKLWSVCRSCRLARVNEHCENFVPFLVAKVAAYLLLVCEVQRAVRLIFRRNSHIQNRAVTRLLFGHNFLCVQKSVDYRRVLVNCIR
jgi:hypothetical protein